MGDSLGRRILIADPDLSGHHTEYVRQIGNAFVREGAEIVYATCEGAMKDEALPVTVRDWGDRYQVVTLPYPMGGSHVYVNDSWMTEIQIRYRFWRWNRSALREAELFAGRVDAMVMPYYDPCFRMAAVLGSPVRRIPVAGICMRPTFHHKGAGIQSPRRRTRAVEEWTVRRAVGTGGLAGLWTLEEPMMIHARAKWGQSGQRMHFLADPHNLGETMDRREARERLGIGQDRVVVSSYGAIHYRKGVGELLSLVEEAGSDSPVVVVLGGRPWGLEERLSGEKCRRAMAEGRLVTLFRFLDTEEEEMVLRASDVVWLRYQAHFGSSGLLSLAAAADVPVVSCDEGLIAWETRRYGLGEFRTEEPLEDQLVRMAREKELGSEGRLRYAGERRAEIVFGRFARHVLGFIPPRAG